MMQNRIVRSRQCSLAEGRGHEATKKGAGGESGIRTHERLTPLPVFKTGAFNRSAISPARGGKNTGRF